MVGKRVGGSDRRGLRRRSLLAGAGVAGAGAVAGCISPTDEVAADTPAEELIREGFDATGVDPPFETSIVLADDGEWSQLAQLFRAELEATGFFDVTIDAREFGSYLQLLKDAAADETNAMFVASWTGGWDPDDYVNALFHSANHTPDGNNVVHYANDRVDDRIDAGLEETDRDERIEIYRDLQRTLVAESPASFVRFREAAHVWNDDAVTDWRTYPLRPGSYYAIYAPWAGVYTDLEDGDEFVGDLGADVTATDPVEMTDTVSSQATSLLYEPLVGIDFEGDARPVLADDWTRLDPTTYRFSLRDGVRFHNGEELTAAHVVRSLERYEGTPRENDVYAWYEDGEVIDDGTVEIECWREYGPLEESLFDVPIVPMAAIEGRHDLDSEPIGTGPYRFVDHQPDDHWRVERFGDHWFGGDDAVPSTPPIETVTLEIVTERASRQAALERGDIDFSYNVPSAGLADFEADDAYGVDRRISGGFDAVFYPCYREPFSDARVRRGCNAVLPREEVLETVYHGNGRVAYTPISPLLEDYADPEFQEAIADEYVRLN